MQNKEIAHQHFKIPLKYQKTYSIENNLVNDLELFETQNPSNKPVVNYLFNPTNELGKKINERKFRDGFKSCWCRSKES